MTTTPPANMSADELVTMIDRYGRLQAQHGDAARLAHDDPTNMGLGEAAVKIETESTLLRFDLGEAVVWLCENDSETTEGQMCAVIEVIDGWAFGLWSAAWHAAPGGAIDGGGLDEWRRLEVEPHREVWSAAVRALVERRDARATAGGTV